MADYRVLHLVTSEEIFFRQQIETLEDKGVDCTVCVVPGGEQIDGAMPEKRGVKEYLRFLPKVRRALRRGSYDLIHANYGLTAPYAVTQFRLPTVLTLWGSDVVGFDRLVTKACAWRVDAVTVRSQEMRDILGREDAYIVPSGVDLDRFRPIDRREARERVGWEVDGRHVLFPYASDYERKNYPLAERVVDQTEVELGEEIRLHSISGVPHEEMPYYINAADLVLLTAKYEGSPNTVKEAVACNIPVVSTDVGDVRRRLDRVSPGGVAATEVGLVKELCTVLGSNSPRTNGRGTVKDMSWDRIGDQLIDIYRSL